MQNEVRLASDGSNDWNSCKIAMSSIHPCHTFGHAMRLICF